MRKTLLLADDSVTIQKVVGITFANEDVELVTVDNGDEALSRAREIRPDLVLADVAMPGLSGYELCRSMRQDPELAPIPVLLLTGTFETFDEQRAAEVGASGHIAKPFEAQALIDRVHALLEEAALASPSPSTPEAFARLEPPGAEHHEPMAASPKEPEVVEDDAPAPHPLDLQPESPPLPPLDPPWSEESEISADDLREEPTGEPFLGATMSQASQPPSPGLASAEASAREPVLGETTVPPIPEIPAPPEPESDSADSWSPDLEEQLQFAEPEAVSPSESQEPTRVHAQPDVGLDPIEEPERAPVLEANLPQPLPQPPLAPAAPEPGSEALEEAPEEEEPNLPWAEALEEEPMGAPRELGGELPEADALFEDSLRFADDQDESAPTLDPEFSATRTSEESAPSTGSEREHSLSEEWPEEPVTPAPLDTSIPKVTAEETAYASVESLDPEVLRQALEKVAWEAFGSLSQEVVREVVRKAEEIAWEVIPQLAERLILEEIARLKTDPPPE
jgi:CheY-like chemotaxis protein